ncbi:translation elongation factor Ts [Chloroflexota bacterium]
MRVKLQKAKNHKRETFVDISVSDVKTLREQTGAGIMDCKKALIDACGDFDKAAQIIKEKGLETVNKKAHRDASDGLIEIYVHNGRIGAMVEVNCETDFVAKTDQFRELARSVAMQIAAMGPLYLSEKDIPDGQEVDPKQACLLSQPFVKDESVTIQDMVNEAIAKVGENIKIKRFTRYELGCS